MIPREPARNPSLGFLYLPPYRIQGISIAGEQSFVQVPELDVCFDIGTAPRTALSSNHVALTHGHMDHTAGLAYYFSQRHFQGMGTGTVICHPALEKPIRGVMEAWVTLESQRTPFNLVALEHEGEFEIKNNIYLRGFETVHTVPSLGFVVVEKRSKLKPQYVGLSQEELVQIKAQGQEITQTLTMPLVCYTGDTMWGKHFERDDVLNAPILITECTFLEPDHRSRAGVGKHLHLDHIIDLLEASSAQAVVLTHLSRRTHIAQARKTLEQEIPPRHRDRLFLLMDGRTNRQRYEAQVAECSDPAAV